MITGLDDDVCYPETQFAIYNRLECPKRAFNHARICPRSYECSSQ